MDLTLDEPLLTPDDEIDLARRIEAGALAEHLLATGRTLRGATQGELAGIAAEGRAARDRFVRANLRLVAQVARVEARRTGLPVDELFQEGALGVITAVDRFDHTRGLRFSTFAVAWIRSLIGKAALRRCGDLHLSTHHADLRRLALSAARRLAVDLRREPTSTEVAAELGRPVDLVAPLLAFQRPASLSTPDGGSLECPDPEAQQSFADVDHALVTAQIPLDALNDEERSVIGLRFGLDGREPRAYADVAGQLGLSTSSVRRRERAALARLRSRMGPGSSPLVRAA
ncbi:sigma-70 family RNA polymerase sigma factor [Mariniluteicoccus flavus]